MLSVREVASLWGVHRATVYGLIERGELEHVRVANAIRIPLSALKDGGLAEGVLRLTLF